MADIIDGQVVETIRTDLSAFIEQKKQQLAMYEKQRDFAAAKAAEVVAELSALVVQDAVS